MEVVKSRQRPRCTVCGSSAIILCVPCVWHLVSQSWRAVQPQLAQGADGAFRPQGPFEEFRCQECEEIVGVKFGRG